MRWHALSAAGVLAIAGCASLMGGQSRQASTSPEGQQATAAQRQSEQALDQASDAQKKASAQAQKAAKAQQDVQTAQRQLTEAQQRAQQEQQKAEQLQQQANEATRQAGQVAQRSQRQASEALGAEGQRVARGEQTITGQIVQAQGTQLSVRPEGGHTLTLDVSPETRVRVGASQGTLDDLKPGENARVSYDLASPRPRALTIEVLQPGASPSGSAGSQPSSGSGAQDTGSRGWTGSSAPEASPRGAASGAGSAGSSASADGQDTCSCGEPQQGTQPTPRQ